jgi:hypothetical protein
MRVPAGVHGSEEAKAWPLRCSIFLGTLPQPMHAVCSKVLMQRRREKIMDTPHFSHHTRCILFTPDDVSSCQRHTAVSTCRDTHKMANGRAQTSGCHRSPALGTPIKRRSAQEHHSEQTPPTSKPRAHTIHTNHCLLGLVLMHSSACSWCTQKG